MGSVASKWGWASPHRCWSGSIQKQDVLSVYGIWIPPWVSSPCPGPRPQLLCPECCSGCPFVLRPPVSANHLSISQLKTPPSTSFYHSKGVVHTPQPGVLGLCRSGPFSLSSIVEATLHSLLSLPHTPPNVWLHSMHHHLHNPLHTLFQLPGMLFHGLRVKQTPTHPSEPR